MLSFLGAVCLHLSGPGASLNINFGADMCNACFKLCQPPSSPGEDQGAPPSTRADPANSSADPSAAFKGAESAPKCTSMELKLAKTVAWPAVGDARAGGVDLYIASGIKETLVREVAALCL